MIFKFIKKPTNTIGFIVSFILLNVWIIYKINHNSKSLSGHSVIASANVSTKTHLTNVGNLVRVKFLLNSDTIKTKVINPNKCYGAIKEGSVMLIRYAKEDPKVVEILACHYNEHKHKHLIGREYSDELEIEE